MSDTVSLLEREIYGFGQVDRIVELSRGHGEAATLDRRMANGLVGVYEPESS